MPISKYRINMPTIVLVFENGHHLSHTIPKGALITVDANADLFGSDGLLDIMWNGRTVKMFRQDFRSRRGQRIEDVLLAT